MSGKTYIDPWYHRNGVGDPLTTQHVIDQLVLVHGSIRPPHGDDIKSYVEHSYLIKKDQKRQCVYHAVCFINENYDLFTAFIEESHRKHIISKAREQEYMEGIDYDQSG